MFSTVILSASAFLVLMFAFAAPAGSEAGGLAARGMAGADICLVACIVAAFCHVSLVDPGRRAEARKRPWKTTKGRGGATDGNDESSGRGLTSGGGLGGGGGGGGMRTATVMVCHHCKISRPMKTTTKHCRLCNKCVSHFDHHCKWLDTCVGARNYASFFTLISGASVMSLLHIIGTAVAIADLTSSSSRISSSSSSGSVPIGNPNSTSGAASGGGGASLSSPAATTAQEQAQDSAMVPSLAAGSGAGWVVTAAIGMVLHVICFLPITALTIFHVYLLSRGITTLDWFKEQWRKKEEKKEKRMLAAQRAEQQRAALQRSRSTEEREQAAQRAAADEWKEAQAERKRQLDAKRKARDRALFGSDDASNNNGTNGGGGGDGGGEGAAERKDKDDVEPEPAGGAGSRTSDGGSGSGSLSGSGSGGAGYVADSADSDGFRVKRRSSSQSSVRSRAESLLDRAKDLRTGTLGLAYGKVGDVEDLAPSTVDYATSGGDDNDDNDDNDGVALSISSAGSTSMHEV